MKKTAIALAVGLAFSNPLLAGQSEDRAAKIEAEFRARIQAIQDEANRLKGDRPSDVGALVGMDCDTKMGLQTISMHLPETTMRLQEWSFDVPEFTWAITSIGPIKLHLPQVRMGRQTVKLHIPEVTMKLHTVKLHMPEFTCKNVEVEMRRTETRGRNLAARGKAVAAKMQSDVKGVHAQELRTKQADALKQIDGAIEGLRAWIASLAKSKANTAELEHKLQDLLVQREAIEKRFDAALQQLG